MERTGIAVAEALRAAGYATGHFGKWHVGGLSQTVKQSYFEGPVDPATYSPPWENGFDECFSTESMMPTYNPYYHLGGDFGTPEYRHLQTEPVAKGQRNGGFRKYLRDRGLADNTILWFCSDNGPSYIHGFNSADAVEMSRFLETVNLELGKRDLPLFDTAE